MTILDPNDHPKQPPRRVNPRDVWTVLWVGLVFWISLELLWETRRILVWLFVAVFFAAALSPLVAFLVRRGIKRGLAVTIVVLGLLLALGGLTYAFVQPLVDEATNFADDLPELVDELREKPVVKDVLDRFNIEDRIEQSSEDLPKRLIGLSGPLLDAFKTVGELIIALLTIFVLMIFLLLYGPRFVESGLEQVPEGAKRDRIRHLGNDLLKSVSGWVAGNVLTTVVAAVVSVIVFAILGLQYGALLALWVGIADLIPLVGASLGAIPAMIVAFIDSPTTGIIITVYFIAYQQFENHILQPYVYGKTIQLNPFVVLVSVLIGVELAGFLGALFALPIAGGVSVIVGYATESRRPPAAKEAHDPLGPETVE